MVGMQPYPEKMCFCLSRQVEVLEDGTQGSADASEGTDHTAFQFLCVFKCLDQEDWSKVRCEHLGPGSLEPLFLPWAVDLLMLRQEK